MIRNPFMKWLWDSRRSIIGWTLGIVVAACGYAAFWPTIANPELQAALENYPRALLDALNYNDISTPAGYLTATVYGLIAALLLAVFGIASGTRTIAGDEEAGTLDLILAHPISRRRLAVQRFGGFAASVTVIVAVLWLGMLAISGPAQLTGISAAQFAAMHVHLAAFGILFGALSFAVGAASGRRGLALGVGAGAAVLAYAASGIIPQVNGLAWVKDYSPFTWLTGSEPLRNGLDLADVGLLLGISALLVAAGTYGFVRRDIAG